MLYKPIKASPNATNIDIDDENACFEFTVPKKQITGYAINVYDNENGEFVGRVVDDVSLRPDKFPSNEGMCDFGHCVNNSEGLQNGDSLSNLLNRGKEYTWNCQYWGKDTEISQNIDVYRFYGDDEGLLFQNQFVIQEDKEYNMVLTVGKNLEDNAVLEIGMFCVDDVDMKFSTGDCFYITSFRTHKGLYTDINGYFSFIVDADKKFGDIGACWAPDSDALWTPTIESCYGTTYSGSTENALHEIFNVYCDFFSAVRVFDQIMDDFLDEFPGSSKAATGRYIIKCKKATCVVPSNEFFVSYPFCTNFVNASAIGSTDFSNTLNRLYENYWYQKNTTATNLISCLLTRVDKELKEYDLNFWTYGKFKSEAIASYFPNLALTTTEPKYTVERADGIYNSDGFQISPDYYFNTRSTPSFSINILNRKGNASSAYADIPIVNDMFATVTVDYSQAEGVELNSVQYTLYKWDGSDKTKIFESPILTNETDSTFEYTFNGLIPNGVYAIEAWGIDDDGIFQETYLKFQNACEIFNNLKEALQDTSVSEMREADLEFHAEVDNCNGTVDVFYTGYPRAFYNLEFEVYRQVVGNNVGEFVGKRTVMNKGLFESKVVGGTDYSLENHREYKYFIKLSGSMAAVGEIFPRDKLEYTDEAGHERVIQGYIDMSMIDYYTYPEGTVPIDSVPIGNRLFLNFGYGYMDVSPGQTWFKYHYDTRTLELLDDITEETQLEYIPGGDTVYCKYYTDLEEFDCTLETNEISTDFRSSSILSLKNNGDKYELNKYFASKATITSDDTQLQINMENNYLKGFDLFEKEQKGYVGNIVGQETIMLDLDTKCDEWIDFVNSDTVKILKTYGGKTMVVGIASSSIQPYYFPAYGELNEVSFNYREIGDVRDFPVFEDLEELKDYR